MTQVFAEDGTVTPVTLVQAGPCTVTEVKSEENNTYNAIVIGHGTSKKVNKAQREVWKELGSFAVTREFRSSEAIDAKRGDVIDVACFEVGDRVDVIGTSKGRGFQGVVKRHGFKGGPASHGHKDQLRMPGSIGAQGPQRVLKGKRMAGRMGTDRVTVQNLEIVKINAKENILAVKGALPGAFGSLVMIRACRGKTIWA